jgi:hypothetical protein
VPALPPVPLVAPPAPADDALVGAPDPADDDTLVVAPAPLELVADALVAADAPAPLDELLDDLPGVPCVPAHAAPIAPRRMQAPSLGTRRRSMDPR